MIAVLFATSKEAAPLLDRMATRAPIAELTQDVYRYSHLDTTILAAVIGMGKQASFHGTRHILDRFGPQSVLNVGIAGALSSGAAVGDICRVAKAVDWEETGKVSYPCSPSCFSDLPALTLVTSAEPVFDDAVRRTLSVYGDIVDMEGAIVAAACFERGISCTLIKGISDNAGQNDREVLHKNIVRISEQLADLVIDRIARLAAFP